MTTSSKFSNSERVLFQALVFWNESMECTSVTKSEFFSWSVLLLV